MKARTCFVHVPVGCTEVLKSGRYTMYWYGPSQKNPERTIVESLEGVLTTVPKEWVRLI